MPKKIKRSCGIVYFMWLHGCCGVNGKGDYFNTGSWALKNIGLYSKNAGFWAKGCKA